MAAITPTVTPQATNSDGIVFWEQINQDDTGAAIEVGRFNRGTIMFYGTWDSGSRTLQGSPDGTNYVTLNDINGDAITASADGSFDFITNMTYFKIITSSGTTEDVDVKLIYR